MKEISVLDRERHIAQESFSAGLSFERASILINFPKDVSGLTIVDIGAGASPAVLGLQEHGAKAIAVDYRYEDLKDLKTSIDRDLSGNRMNQVLSIARGMGESIKDTRGDMKQYARSMRKDMGLFFHAHENRKIQLVAASAGSLPFRDESVDFIFSIQCISRFLIKDRDVFINVVSEATRVLRPGGELQLHPWISTVYDWNKEDKYNAWELKAYLKEQNMPYFVEQIGSMISPRLRIVKPSK